MKRYKQSYTTMILDYFTESNNRKIITNQNIGKNLLLYIHIPFCESFCSYCPFYKIKYNKEIIERFLTNIIAEIYLYRSFFSSKSLKYVHFGGGSPSLLTINQIKRIIDTIKVYSENISFEISIEISPLHLSTKILNEYKSIGINRVSVGLQSFSYSENKEYGRIKHYDKIINNIQFLSTYYNNFNVDLIIGAPNQTLKSINDSLIKAIKLNPGNITLYPWTSKNHLDQLDRFFLYNSYKLSYNILKFNNYVQTGSLSFGKVYPNNFNELSFEDKMLDRDTNFIGVGPSAFSNVSNCAYINTNDINTYIQLIEKGAAPQKLFFNKYTIKIFKYILSLSSSIFSKKIRNIELELLTKLKILRTNNGNNIYTFNGLYDLIYIYRRYQQIHSFWILESKKFGWNYETFC